MLYQDWFEKIFEKLITVNFVRPDFRELHEVNKYIAEIEIIE